MFDVQGHLLEYDLNPILNGQDFWTRFPQQNCGEDDPRVCFSIDTFMELMFLRSDTSMLVLSALPIYPRGQPAVAEDHGRDPTDRRGPLPRRARAAPRAGAPQRGTAAGRARRDGARREPLSDRRVEDVHALPRRVRGQRQRVVARRPRPGAAAGRASASSCKARDLGIPTICTHKGFSGGSPYASPVDVGPAARRHPDMNFVDLPLGVRVGRRRRPVHASDREHRREPADHVA